MTTIFAITDTQTGKTFQLLSIDAEGAKRVFALKVSDGQGTYMRGRVVSGARYQIEGQSFDVELFEDRPAPKPQATSYQRGRPSERPMSAAERAWAREDEAEWFRLGGR